MNDKRTGGCRPRVPGIEDAYEFQLPDCDITIAEWEARQVLVSGVQYVASNYLTTIVPTMDLNKEEQREDDKPFVATIAYLSSDMNHAAMLPSVTIIKGSIYSMDVGESKADRCIEQLILSVESLTDEQIEQLRAAWSKLHKGGGLNT